MRFRLAPIFCLLAALMTGTVSADPVSAYLSARHASSSSPLTASMLSDVLAHPGSYAGRTLDIAVTVSGLVTAGDERTALLSSAGQSVSVPLPAKFNGEEWIASGARVRVLLQVAPDDASLPAGVRLLAAVPEGDVVAAENAEASRQAAVAARLSSLPTSRRHSRRYAVVNYADDPAGAGHPAGALPPRALAIYGPYRSLVRRWNRRLSETDVDKITTSILYFSDRNDIDPRLVVATIIAESDFDIHSTSHAGAMGLAQIMPDEAQSLGVTNPYDPIQNIGHLEKYGGAPAGAGIIPVSRILLTMAAYNAGPGAVHKYHGVPPYRETRRYVAKIAALYRQMCGTDVAQAGPAH
jgi:soluble lytic murein transglycosylase-like protein